MHGLPPVIYAVEGRRAALRALYPLISADAPTTWIHVAMEGTWEGHSAGSFSFTREVFEQIVANYDANPNPLPMDYEHATEVAIPAPAAGWVQGLEVRDAEDGSAELWAHVELTEQAAEYIRTGAYRFSSGVFDFESRDLKSGEAIGVEMLSLALTNVPFLRGQTPVQLSRRRAAEGVTMSKKRAALGAATDKLAQLAGMLGVSLEDAEDQWGRIFDAVSAVQQAATAERAIEAAPPAAEEPAEMADKPDDEDKDKREASRKLSASEEDERELADDSDEDDKPAAMDASEEAESLLAQVMAETGMDLAALVEALKALAGADESAAVTPLSRRLKEQQVTLAAHTATIAALSARAEGAEKRVAEYEGREADAAVDVLVDTGRLLDNGRAEMRSLYLSNRKAFDALSASLPAVVPVGAHASGQTPPTQDTPAINEDDPEVKSLRRMFSTTRLPKAQQDAAIAKAIATRRGNNARV